MIVAKVVPAAVARYAVVEWRVELCRAVLGSER